MPKLSYPKGRTASALKTSGSETADVPDPALENEIIELPEKTAAEVDDASVAFQKQIDALRKSEQSHKERAEQAVKDSQDAIKRAKEREAENTQLKQTTIESKLDSLQSSLAAHQAEADSAQSALEKAHEIGDFKGIGEAQRRMSKADAAISQLEYGKVELEEQVKASKEQKVNIEPVDELDKFNLPDRAKDWLRAHPDYLKNARKNARIQALHYDVVDEGHEAYSQEYFESLEQHLGMREKPVNMNDEQEDQPEPRTRSVVSAPVSREAPSNSNGERPGTVRLSVAQKEAAKIAGVTEKEYAENLLKLRAEKLNGNYGGQQ